MERKKSATKRTFLLAILVTVVTFFAAFREDLFQVSKNLEIFSSVYKELSINYVDEINSSGLMKSSIDAMLEELDPYTSYVPESEIEDYKMQFVNTQYGGIGTSIFV